eukprot:PhM_4_TR10447/c0_g1_i14/m.96346
MQSETLSTLLSLQDAHFELFQRYANGQDMDEFEPLMRDVYEQFFNICNARFKAQLAHHGVTQDEFQRRWNDKDPTIRNDHVFRDLYNFQKEISDFEKFAQFMKTHVDAEITDMPSHPQGLPYVESSMTLENEAFDDMMPDTPVTPTDTDNTAVPTTMPSRTADINDLQTRRLTAAGLIEEDVQSRTFQRANEKEILIFWDTENVHPDGENTNDSVNLLRSFIIKENIGNPLRMSVEAFFCPFSQLTLSPKQMWGLRQASVTMVACCEAKKEEVDRQMERRIRREALRTTPERSTFVVISGDCDFNSVIEDVAQFGYDVHLLTPQRRSTVYEGSGIKVHHNFTFHPGGEKKKKPEVPLAMRMDSALPDGVRSPSSRPLLLKIPSARRLSEVPISLTPTQGSSARFYIKRWNGNSGYLVGRDDKREVFVTGAAFMNKTLYQSAKDHEDLDGRFVLMYTHIAKLSLSDEKRHFVLEAPPACLDLEVFRIAWWKNGTQGLLESTVKPHPYPRIYVQKIYFVDVSLQDSELRPGTEVIIRHVPEIEFVPDPKHNNFKLQAKEPCLHLLHP